MDQKNPAKALLLTRLASSLNGRHSPKAFKRVVMFFFGSGLDNAKIIGLWGFARKRITCKDNSQSHYHVSNEKSMHTATKILTSDHIGGNAFGEDPSVLVSINSPSASSS